MTATAKRVRRGQQTADWMTKMFSHQIELVK
jgi:hypothetical protein